MTKDIYSTVQQLLMAENHENAAQLILPENINDVKVDNWNGGIFDIHIKVPIQLFASWKKLKIIEDKEKIILEAFKDSTKDNDYDPYRNVVFIPDSEAVVDEQLKVISDDDIPSWQRGYYRMFISHLTDDRLFAAQLKSKLNTIGISCFVAHEDIEPTKTWQDEIVKALKTSDGLCAIISKHFIDSKWCDQEVGFCLGRNLLCIPLLYGSVPYGIMGMRQGIKCANRKLNPIAVDIFNVLCTNILSKDKYTKCIADLFLQSNEIDKAMKWITVMGYFVQANINIFEYIRDHYQENNILLDSNVLGKVNELYEKFGLSPIAIGKTPVVDLGTDLPF